MLMWGCAEKPAPPVSRVDFSTPTSASPTTRSRPEVTFRDGSKIIVEVVADPETRAQGLMYRPYLSPDRGMLFIFPEAAEQSFWMKNTLIPLDLLWIDARRTVVHLAENLPPCQADPCPSYSSNKKSLYVLELAAGQVAERGIRTGDVVTFTGGIENIVPR